MKQFHSTRVLLMWRAEEDGREEEWEALNNFEGERSFFLRRTRLFIVKEQDRAVGVGGAVVTELRAVGGGGVSSD